MEKDYTQYKNKRDKVRNDLGKYEVIINYALENPERIFDNIYSYIEVIRETENFIRTNDSKTLGCNPLNLAKKVKELELIIGRIFVDKGMELVRYES